MNDKCPRCGEHQTATQGPRYIDFKCGSYIDRVTGGFSGGCTPVNESAHLRADLERVTKERDELRESSEYNYDLWQTENIKRVQHMIYDANEIKRLKAQRDRAMELIEDCNSERNGWISRCARLKEEIAKEKEGR